MSAARKLLSAIAASAVDDRQYVDDVFTTYLYPGNSGTQALDIGLDMTTGGMAWIKVRDDGFSSHFLTDSLNGTTKALSSNLTAAAGAVIGGTVSLTATGISLNGNITTAAGAAANNAAYNYVLWAYREATNFFQQVLVSHTGGVADNVDLSDLGVVGMAAVKRVDASSDWLVWHRGMTPGKLARWNSTDPEAADTSLSVSGTTLTLAAALPTGDYIVYAWAHDDTADGLIECGSFATDGSGHATIEIGWEPQFLEYKDISSSSNWILLDNPRGVTADGLCGVLVADSAAGLESTGTLMSFNATGFSTKAAHTASSTFVFRAIRRSNRPPTSGTQIYAGIARTGTGAATTVSGAGFAPDIVIGRNRSPGNPVAWYDRKRKPSARLSVGATAVAEVATTDQVLTLTMDGMTLGAESGTSHINASGIAYMNWLLKRAAGAIDQVCDIGTGAPHSLAHSLGVVPELLIRKARSAATDWEVWSAALLNSQKLVLNSTAARANDANAWNSTAPDAASFTVGTSANVNTASTTYTTYLFATLAGVSKVGSYIGNGGAQPIDCGFGAGARFVMIKCASGTGDWFLWDSARGIVAGNDPHVSMNTSAAEVTTDDSIDPNASGFIVNQVGATNINVLGSEYVFLAIA